MNESSVQIAAAAADGNQTRGGKRTNEVADGNQKRSRESTTEVEDAVAAPTMGGEDMSVENNGMPRQEWSMDLMNPQDLDNNLAQHVEFDWDETIFPSGDNLWSDDDFFF
ncbi:hypothetical protein PanWU01x14_118250 [Parasponia andersonii]|uniref:Uncharacterized protein n=1 Tax=Parasponia andersonii TaxID=3476 RepID=A0A2P5CW76_PARAD|nr:hypothetical protein PanWU01x14_118250 [Parasponia andersonii]